MSKDKKESYFIRYPVNVSQEVKELVDNVNMSMVMLEDRLDVMEAIRGKQYFVTANWERLYVN